MRERAGLVALGQSRKRSMVVELPALVDISDERYVFVTQQSESIVGEYVGGFEGLFDGPLGPRVGNGVGLIVGECVIAKCS